MDNTTLIALTTTSLLAAATLAFYSSSVLKWMQRKRYQYEVTFSLYMMTPTEKFIFSTSVSTLIHPPLKYSYLGATAARHQRQTLQAMTQARTCVTPTDRPHHADSILFLFLAMVSIAASLYLPSHISTITRRAYYYALGDIDSVGAAAVAAVKSGGLPSGGAGGVTASSVATASASAGSGVRAVSEVGQEVVGAARDAVG